MSYHYIPSGATPSYLKWHFWHRPIQGEGNKFEVIQDRGPSAITAKRETDRRAEGYDLIRVGPYHHPDTYLKGISDIWMASAHVLDPRMGNFAEAAGVKMLADSGGWQIKSGAADYVDPHAIIATHNACAHIGMALDYPPRRDVDTTNEVLSLLSKIQVRHNEVFLAKRRPDLELINVAHGVASEQWKAWIDAVDTKEGFQGWAISEDSNKDPFCVLRGAAILYRDYGIRDQRVHLFGISGPLMVPVAAWLSRYFPNLTSDSSSWQGARYGNYLYSSNGALRILKIGWKDPEISDGTPVTPYCDCTFCRILGTFEGYRKAGAHPALSAHNVTAIQASVKFWNDQAARVDYDTYVKQIRESFPKVEAEQGRKGEKGTRARDPAKSVLGTLAYLKAAMENGPEVADRHVRDF